MLTTQSIQQKRIKRAKVNHTTYKLLYNVLTNKIRAMQDVRPPTFKCSWQLPSMYPGRPLFSQERAARYIRDKLVWGGFDVNVDWDTYMIHVSWASILHSSKTSLSTEQLQEVKRKMEERQKATNPLEDMVRRARELEEKLRY